MKQLKMVFLSLVLLQTACVTKIASKASGDIFYDATPSIDAEDDLELAEQSSLGFLKMLEGLQKADPKNKKLLYLLTRSYSGYAYGFTENKILDSIGNDVQLTTQVERAKRFYGRAKNYGLQLLSHNGSFKKGLTQGLDNYKKALKSFGKSDVPNLFWAAHAWANFLNFSKDSPEAVIELPKIQALIERIVELDPNYYYGAPQVLLAGFLGSRPKMLGGDPERARELFEKALASSDNKFLMAKVAYAQFYAVQTQNVELFKKLLSEVREADVTTLLPEQILINKIAQIRARLLSARMEDFFENLQNKNQKGSKQSSFRS